MAERGFSATPSQAAPDAGPVAHADLEEANQRGPPPAQPPVTRPQPCRVAMLMSTRVWSPGSGLGLFANQRRYADAA